MLQIGRRRVGDGVEWCWNWLEELEGKDASWERVLPVLRLWWDAQKIWESCRESWCAKSGQPAVGFAGGLKAVWFTESPANPVIVFEWAHVSQERATIHVASQLEKTVKGPLDVWRHWQITTYYNCIKKNLLPKNCPWKHLAACQQNCPKKVLRHRTWPWPCFTDFSLGANDVIGGWVLTRTPLHSVTIAFRCYSSTDDPFLFIYFQICFCNLCNTNLSGPIFRQVPSQ